MVDCGLGTVRDLTGVCDWCGDECHCTHEICVALSCQRCDNKLYHQNCVEKYLKKMGLASNRKTGFPCPFGKGKGSKDECKGKVDKSHPIVPKNEEKKKARMAPQLLEAMSKQPKAPKPPAPAKPAAPKLPAMPRKVTPPKPHSLSSGSSSVWGQKGAAPVLANAHLPEPELEPEPAAAAAQPRPAELPVGLVLEEALTKAQRKNLARKKKRQAGAGMETLSEASSDQQDSMAAAAAAGAGSSSSSSVAAGAAGLVGFDGAALGVQNGGVLEQQGHRFITDAAKYAALLGLYVGDSDEEEEEYEAAGDGAEDYSESTSGGYGEGGDINNHHLAAFSPAAQPAPHTPAVAHLQPVQHQQPAVGKDSASDESAFDSAVAASIQQYQLEEEMRRQREALTNGGFGSVSKPAPAAAYAYPGVGGNPLPAPAAHAPVATPMVAPVAVPVAAPIAAPMAAPSAASVLYTQTKQQPEAPATNYYGNGWVFGGGNQGTALPPHLPPAYNTGAVPAVGQYGGYGDATAGQYGNSPIVGAMAAGHSAPEVAADDDDDDLSTLLALCGVAG